MTKKSKQAAKGGSFRYHPPLPGYCSVDCDLCNDRGIFKGGKVASGHTVNMRLPEARAKAREVGWLEYKRGHWACPACVADVNAAVDAVTEATSEASQQ